MRGLYNCPHAKRQNGKVLIFCRVKNNSCGNQRYCPKEGKTILTEQAADCPLRKDRK